MHKRQTINNGIVTNWKGTIRACVDTAAELNPSSNMCSPRLKRKGETDPERHISSAVTHRRCKRNASALSPFNWPPHNKLQLEISLLCIPKPLTFQTLRIPWLKRWLSGVWSCRRESCQRPFPPSSHFPGKAWKSYRAHHGFQNLQHDIYK